MVKKILIKYNSIPVGAKAALWFVFCSSLQKCASLITTPIFTRLMTKEQYGQFSVYNSWLQIFTIVATLRLNGAVFNKGMSKYKKDRDGYTSTMQTITFTITVCMLALYLIFHKQINRLTELPTFVMLAIFLELLVTPAIDFWTLRKRYEYIYVPVVIRTVLMVLLNSALGIFAVIISDEKGYARILSCALANLCVGCTLFTYNRKKGKIWFKKEYARFALTFNLPLLLHYFSQYILEQFDHIMVQKMVSVAAAGVYSISYNVGLLLRIVTQSINSALVPWQYECLEQRKFKKMNDVLFATYVIVSVCAVGISAFAPEIMRILAGEKYYEGVYVIPPVAIGLLFLFMYTTFANIEFFYDENKFSMYISMAVALLNVVLNYIGIRMFSYIAAAYTTLICFIIFSVGHYIYMSICVKKKIGMEKVLDTKRLLLLSAVVAAIGIVMPTLYNSFIIRFLIMVAILFIAIIFRQKFSDVFANIKK